MRASNLAIIALVLLFSSAPALTAAEEDMNNIKDSVQTKVQETVNASKDFLSGLMEGLNAAGQDGPTFEKSQIVTSKADLARLLKVEVVKVENLDNGQYELVAALRNNNDFPVLVTGLTVLGNVVLLDKDGFSYALPNRTEQGRDITALARSATRARFTFTGVEGRPATFRLFDTDISIPRW